MTPLLLAAALAVAQPAVRAAAHKPKVETCETGCDERGCWLLVYRYSFLNEAGRRQVVETFDGERTPTEEAGYCRAEELRRTGVRLPTLERYGRDSNVMPETITPMPHMLAIDLGIQPAHPELEP